MSTQFHRKVTQERYTTSPPEASKGLWQPEMAATLLATPRRQRLLEHVWQRTSLSREQFHLLYHKPFQRYAALVQLCPASESHHHAYPGGMLDHGLEIVAFALKLRQSHLLPVGAPPETQAAQSEAWTAAVAYASLLHDIGKIAVDLHIEYADGRLWHPWNGPLSYPYRFRYRKRREYQLHNAATGLLYRDVLDTPILDWLSGYPQLWASLLYVLAGQYEHAGILGELVVKADQASVASALGGDPGNAKEAPTQALQRKLLDGLRYLTREQLRLNQSEASDGWLTDDALWLVSKTVCDKLRAHLLSHGIEGVPSTNVAVFDVLQEHGLVQPTGEGKAIWHATVESNTGWSHSFTFLRMSPALIWDRGERPPPFTGTVRLDANPTPNSPEGPSQRRTTEHRSDKDGTPAVEWGRDPRPDVGTEIRNPALDLLTQTLLREPVPDPADPAPPEPDIQQSGAETTHAPISPESAVPDSTQNTPVLPFIEWLRDSIRAHRLIINDAKALIHTVAGTAFLVSPGIFHKYTTEQIGTARRGRQDTSTPSWESTQKSFERLRLHRKRDDGLNIWTCVVTGPRKTRRLHGYLLIEGHSLFAEIPPDNPYLKLSISEEGDSQPLIEPPRM